MNKNNLQVYAFMVTLTSKTFHGSIGMSIIIRSSVFLMNLESAQNYLPDEFINRLKNNLCDLKISEDSVNGALNGGHNHIFEQLFFDEHFDRNDEVINIPYQVSVKSSEGIDQDDLKKIEEIIKNLIEKWKTDK